jgi:hypothetical protein
VNNRVFILDADVLIHAYRYDFPPSGKHDGFWEWLDILAASVDIFIPESVMKEIKEGNDGLFDLLHTLKNLKHHPTSEAILKIPDVLRAYGALTEIDVEIIGRRADPYIIAHAMLLNASVITNEIPEPGRTVPRNKKIPDICSALNVDCIRYPHFLWEMRGR